MARNNGRAKASKRLVSKHVRRKWQKTKPMRIAALIVSAIQDLRETKGSTSKKIISYIRCASNLPENRVKRQVNLTQISIISFRTILFFSPFPLKSFSRWIKNNKKKRKIILKAYAILDRRS